MTREKKHPALVEQGYGQGLYITNEAVFRVTYKGDSSNFVITSIYGIDTLKKTSKVVFIGPHFRWSAAEQVFVENGLENIVCEVAANEEMDPLELLKMFNDPYVLDSSKIEAVNRLSIKKYGYAIYYDNNKNQWGVAKISML